MTTPRFADIATFFRLPIEKNLAELEKLVAKIERNGQGEVVEVGLDEIKITEAALVHHKRMTKLKILYFNDTKVTDVGVSAYQGAGQSAGTLDRLPPDRRRRTDVPRGADSPEEA